MQTQSEKILKKNVRPKGSLGRAAIKRNAIKTLEQITNDLSATYKPMMGFSTMLNGNVSDCILYTPEKSGELQATEFS